MKVQPRENNPTPSVTFAEAMHLALIESLERVARGEDDPPECDLLHVVDREAAARSAARYAAHSRR